MKERKRKTVKKENHNKRKNCIIKNKEKKERKGKGRMKHGNMTIR